MSTNFGQYPNYSMYNQGTFKGDSGNSLVDTASGAAKGAQSSLVKTGVCMGAGVATAFGVDQFVNTMVKPRPNLSYLERFMNRIDNSFIVKNPVSQGMGGYYKRFCTWVGQQKTSFASNHPTFSKYFETGFNRSSGLVQPLLDKQVVADLVEHTNSLLDKKKISITTPLEKEAHKSFQDIIKHLKTNKVEHQIIESITKDAKIELLNNKLSILKNSSGRSFLSRATAKSSIGLGHMMGGGLMALVFGGMFLGMSFKSAAEAKKGEKASTFSDSFLGDFVGGFVGMYPVAKAFNGIGNAFENQAGNGFVAKTARFIGKAMNWGHTEKSWTSAKTFTEGFGKSGFLKSGVNGKWLYKAVPGGIGRMIVCGWIANKLFSDPIKWVSHKILGTPTKPEDAQKANPAKPTSPAQLAATPANVPPYFLNGQQLQNMQNQKPVMPTPAQTFPQNLQQQALVPAPFTQQPAVNFAPVPPFTQPLPPVPPQFRMPAPKQPNVDDQTRTYIPSSSVNPALLHPQPQEVKMNDDLSSLLQRTDATIANAQNQF